MATVPNPRTWTVGELLTASKLNTDLRDGMNFLLSPPRTLLHKTASQSVNNTTWTVLTWNSEQYDNDGGHSNSTNNSRYTAQTAGWFTFTANILWASSGERGARFLKNGSGNPFGEAVINGYAVHITGWTLLSVNDYVEVMGYQNSGGSLLQAESLDSSPAFFAGVWSGKN